MYEQVSLDFRWMLKSHGAFAGPGRVGRVGSARVGLGRSVGGLGLGVGGWVG